MAIPVVVTAIAIAFVLTLSPSVKNVSNRLFHVLLTRLVFLVIFIAALFIFARYWIVQALSCSPNCIGVNLIGGDLSGSNLSGINLVGANMLNADLNNTDLSNADLSGANLQSANLQNANLEGALLIGADLANADLRNTILTNTNFSGANLSGVDFTRTDLTKAILLGADLSATKLVQANLQKQNLAGGTLVDANLTGANLDNANMSGMGMSHANLSGATLRYVDLTGTWLNLANLTGADLTGANLSGTDVVGSLLASTHLRDAHLVGVNMVGANLNGAELFNADLTEARMFLSEVDVKDFLDDALADLNELQRSQIFKDIDLSGVQFDNTTLWPKGKEALLSSLLAQEINQNSQISATVADAPLSTDTMKIVGNASLAPLTQAIYKRYQVESRGEVLDLQGGNATDGFAAFCTSEDVDVVMSNRKMNAQELALCSTNGRYPVAFQVGSIGLVAAVNRTNSSIENVTSAALAQIFTAEKWSDVRPDWPAEPIVRFLPSPEMAEFTLFVEQILNGDQENLLGASNTFTGTIYMQLEEGVDHNPYGVGIFNYGYFEQNNEVIKALAIDTIMPSAATIENGQYPLARPLLLYSTKSTIQKRPLISQFIGFYLTHVNEVILKSSFLPVSQAILDQGLQTLTQISTEDVFRPLSKTLPDTTTMIPSARLTATLDEAIAQISVTIPPSTATASPPITQVWVEATSTVTATPTVTQVGAEATPLLLRTPTFTPPAVFHQATPTVETSETVTLTSELLLTNTPTFTSSLSIPATSSVDLRPALQEGGK